jgi:hypothetical protein
MIPKRHQQNQMNLDIEIQCTYLHHFITKAGIPFFIELFIFLDTTFRFIDYFIFAHSGTFFKNSIPIKHFFVHKNAYLVNIVEDFTQIKYFNQILYLNRNIILYYNIQ